ncbi:MAG TPA: class I SAM-dependent methyltransferase [Burkholderiaceae bacterium]|nr:class I SAM-dependent methyltransferase [Burkholderiaceae bacterium]
MYFGTRETFEYHQCGHCGSLQIAEVPCDLARFYPDYYYSHVPAVSPGKSSPVREWLRRQRTAYALSGRNVVGAALKLAGRGEYFDYPWEWFQDSGVTTSSRILDVGCGSGQLLFSMRLCGFDNLVGIDPFRRESQILDGVSLLKTTLFDLEDRFDLVMSHHSLEHMESPAAALAKMRDLVAPGGALLIRLPVLGQPWEAYGVNWVELDAPRHLFIPSEAGFRALVERVGGLDVTSMRSDGTAFEIAGSELYTRDIPLYPPELAGRSNVNEHFSREEIADMTRKVGEMNASGAGGRATFHLRRH